MVTGYKAFIDEIKSKRGFSMPGYNQMYLAGFDANPPRSFPSVTLQYKGFIGGSPPKEIVTSGLEVKTATVTRSSTIIDGIPGNSTVKTTAFEVVYESSTVTVKTIIDKTGYVRSVSLPGLTYRILVSRWTIVSSSNESEIGRQGSGIPPSLSVLPVSRDPIITDIPYTPFREYSATHAIEIA